MYAHSCHVDFPEANGSSHLVKGGHLGQTRFKKIRGQIGVDLYSNHHAGEVKGCQSALPCRLLPPPTAFHSVSLHHFSFRAFQILRLPPTYFVIVPCPMEDSISAVVEPKTPGTTVADLRYVL